MYYLYGSKAGVKRKLVATFDSKRQLLNYIGWATWKSFGKKPARYEQSSVLAEYTSWDASALPWTTEDPDAVVHNPKSMML